MFHQVFLQAGVSVFNDLDLHIREPVLVFSDDRRHDSMAAGEGDADAQDALLIFIQVGELMLHGAVFFLEVRGVLAEDLACVGEFKGNVADEEFAVQLLLQVGDVGA